MTRETWKWKQFNLLQQALMHNSTTYSSRMHYYIRQHHNSIKWNLNKKMLARLACWTSSPRAQTSVVISTRVAPDLNSDIMASLSCWGMSPCIADTVKLLARILSVSQSTWTKRQLRLIQTINHGKWPYFFLSQLQVTFLLVLQKMTAWVMVNVS